MVDTKDISWVKHDRPEWDENNEEIQRVWSSILKTGVRNIMMTFIVLLMLAFTAGATGNETNATPDTAATVTEGTGADSDSEEELPDDAEEYNGSVGPGNSLYGLKLALEALDETFTFNKSEKLGKQIAHARQRIAEMRSELKKKNDEAANRALEKHREKIKELDEAISEASDDDTGLLHAQKMIAKHQAVLKELVDSYPNNTGLARAYSNSLELEEKFESRTWVEYEIITKKGKKVLREMDIDEIEEKLEIKAEVTGNATGVKVEVKFASSATDNFTIAEEILNRLKLNQENINHIIKIEVEDDEEDDRLKEKLEAKADVRGDISKIKFKYRFPLNVTNRPDITEGVYQKLSAITTADILNVLEMKIQKEKEKTKQKEEKLEIKAEVTGNATEVKVEVKFDSSATDNFTIAEEILNRLKLNQENINRIIKIEVEGDEEDDRLKEKLEAKADVRGDISKIKFEYRFPLNVTNRPDITEGVYQKLSAITTADILDVLEMNIQKEKVEIKQKEKELDKRVKEEMKEKEDMNEKEKNKKDR